MLVFTDSENVVMLFNSHRAIELVRKMFRTAVNLMLDEKIDVKVKHVPGDRNVIADHLSRHNLDLARTKVPDLRINTIPVLPPHMDGSIKKKKNTILVL